MSHSFSSTLNIFKNSNIRFTIGGESLVGLVEGDIYKYTHNLRIYLFPTPTLHMILLALKLLISGVILKPKFEQGRLYYKLRYKPGLLKKDSTFITLLPLNSIDGGFVAFLGGHDTFFAREDLNEASLQNMEVDNLSVLVPENHIKFIQKYSKELMSGFYKKHEVQFDSKSEKKAAVFMHQVVRIMKEAGVDFWIEGGTLLGALRDQKFIPWDHDLDFGMKYESEAQMKHLVRKLRRQYYVSVRSFPKTAKIWQLGNYRVLKIFPRKHLFFKDDLCLDLFVYYEGTLPGKNELVYKYVVWDRNAYHLKKFFDTIDTIEFYGGTVPVPHEAEQFIEAKYGKDWRTPIKEWNVALDDGSIYKED